MASIIVRRVAVIGGGLMGSGIAQVAAQSGHKVTLVDNNQKQLDNAILSIRSSLERVARKKFPGDPEGANGFQEHALAHLSTTCDSEEAVPWSEVDVVVEALPEDPEIKTRVLQRLDAVAPHKVVFATNTSSLRVRELARATSRADRFGGLHFFSPVPLMSLVEVVRAPHTSDKTFDVLMAFTKAIGKTPVTCKDEAGFIVNRLLVPYKLEAFRMYERGDATFQDIDIAMKLGAGYPMGPFELSDLTGLDIGKNITDGWAKRYPDDPRFRSVPMVDKMVEDGKLGRKTGEGFYVYRKKP